MEKYTQSEKDNAVEMLRMGKTYEEVSKISKMSRQTLYYEMKRRGFSKVKVYDQKQLDKAMQYLETHTLVDTWLKTGVSRTKLVREKRRRREMEEGVVQ